jgi:spermidine synthase
MVPWELLDSTPIPGGKDKLNLYRRGHEFSIKIGYTELMNSRLHGSEESLAEVTIEKMVKSEDPRVLVGGLGMGFTLRAVLDKIGDKDSVTVAELVERVVKWNRTTLSHLAGNPLADKRTRVAVADILDVVRPKTNFYNAIILDVDNGPEGLMRKDNDNIYSRGGLRKFHRALKVGGVLTVWSSGKSDLFTERLKHTDFSVEVTRVFARKEGKGGKHFIWVATKQ